MIVIKLEVCMEFLYLFVGENRTMIPRNEVGQILIGDTHATYRIENTCIESQAYEVLAQSLHIPSGSRITGTEKRFRGKVIASRKPNLYLKRPAIMYRVISNRTSVQIFEDNFILFEVDSSSGDHCIMTNYFSFKQSTIIVNNKIYNSIDEVIRADEVGITHVSSSNSVAVNQPGLLCVSSDRKIAFFTNIPIMMVQINNVINKTPTIEIIGGAPVIIDGIRSVAVNSTDRADNGQSCNSSSN